MANSDHIELLRKGVAKWNERQSRGDFEPDLEEAEFSEACGTRVLMDSASAEFRRMLLRRNSGLDLSGIDLGGANLQRAGLENVTFSKANLRFADLRNCALNGASFNSADLDYADLRGASTLGMADFNGASFVRAKLNEADFSGADLSNAILADANLCGADLRHARLSGANLSRTQLWKALLFSKNPTESSKTTLCRGMIRNIGDLLEECSNVQGKYDTKDFLHYFRGEGRDTWELCPSLMRNESLQKAEGEMLVDLMARRPEEFENADYALRQWVLAQHHGLPTRLLDVTQNPLVALFHACENADGWGRLHVFPVSRDMVRPFSSDTISVIANFAKLSFADQQVLLTRKGEFGDAQSAMEFPEARDRLYHLIRQEKPHFQEKINPKDLFRVFIVEPQRSFERLRAQSGAFLISAFHDRFEPDEILKWNDGIPIYDHYTIAVPPDSKQSIIQELRLLNITRETLFPGLDEAATAVTDRIKITSEHK